MNAYPFDELHGYEVVDRVGERVGTVEEVFADATGIPSWVSVNTGLFGLREKMVPLSGASVTGTVVSLPYDKDKVADAPHVDIDEDKDRDYGKLRQLYQHYQLPWEQAAPSATTADMPVRAPGEPALPAVDAADRRGEDY